MAEATGTSLIDGEDAGAGTPWEFASTTSIVIEADNGFALSASAAAHGSYGYEITFGGSNDAAYGVKYLTTCTSIYARMYVYIPSTIDIGGAGDVMRLMTFNGPTGDLVGGIRSSGSAGLPEHWILRTGTAETYVTTNFALATWHYLEMYYLVDASTGGGALWIDGTKVASDIDQAFNTNITSIQVGCARCSANPGAGGYIWIDDFKIDTAAIGAYSDIVVGGTIIPKLMHYYLMRHK